MTKKTATVQDDPAPDVAPDPTPEPSPEVLQEPVTGLAPGVDPAELPRSALDNPEHPLHHLRNA